MTDRVSVYLVQFLPHLQNQDHVAIMDQYYKVTSEFERLGDQAVRISDLALQLRRVRSPFRRPRRRRSPCCGS